MPTTGTNIFTVTRDDIIKAALRLLRVIGVGETPTTEDYTNCSQALNIMIKAWAKKGLPLWVTQDYPINMVTGVTAYSLGPTGGTIGLVSVVGGGTGASNSGTWTSTGGTTGTTASGTFTAVGGIIQTITVVNGGTTYTTGAITITFSSGTGATYTAYVAGVTGSRPLKVIGAFIRDSNSYDTPLIMISRQEYDMQGSKMSPGTPNQFYYDRQEANGVLYLFNVPSDTSHVVHAQIQRQFYDMTSSTDNFDFPEEFFQALKWGLVAEIMAEYEVNLQMMSYYEQKAETIINDSFDYSVEEASVTFSPDPQGTIRHA